MNFRCVPFPYTACYPVIVALVFALLAACAAPAAYYQNIQQLVAGGRFADAAALAEKSRNRVYGEKNALLYYLDRAMLLHYGGEYEESNRHFERAKETADNYFTKSVTAEASTLLVNEASRPYYGEDFERALINFFAAMNYVMLGNESEALVEARQVDHYLKTLQVNYGVKASYKEDAFVRYIMGMIFENQGELNDAFISYRQALDAYREYRGSYGVEAPDELVQDALRTGKALGFEEEVRALQKEWDASLSPSQPGTGELVAVLYHGFAPRKVDSIFEIAFGKAWGYVDSYKVRGEEEQKVEQARTIARSLIFDEQIRLSFPAYEDVTGAGAGAVIRSGGAVSKGKVAQDIGAIARRSLQERINRVRARTIARAAIKYALAHKVSQRVQEQSGNEALGWITRKALAAASAVTEHADKRSWQSLPGSIIVARLRLPAGTHDASILLQDASGNESGVEEIDDVVIRPGKKTFRVLRSPRDNSLSVDKKPS